MTLKEFRLVGWKKEFYGKETHFVLPKIKEKMQFCDSDGYSGDNRYSTTVMG